MIQELITYALLAVAFGAAILRILHFFGIQGKRRKKYPDCMGCAGNCRKNEILPAKRIYK